MKHSKRPIALLLPLAVAATAFYIWHHGRPLSPSHSDAKQQLTVLTWNTAQMGNYKKANQNDVLHFLINQNADVICLQEVDVYKDPHFLTLNEVKQALGKKYPFSYLDFSVYNHRHQYGTMVWSRYPLINKHSIHYQTRSNLSNHCDVVVGTDTLRLINNHLESYRFTPADIEAMETQRNYKGLRSSAQRLQRKWQQALPLRNQQARLVRQEIDDSPHPVIVVGDLNSIACSYAYLTISHGMHDAWRETHWLEWGATCEKRGIGLRIDYILTSPMLHPVACRIDKPQGSDHRPVTATLEW